jgi:hypothetical protein
MSANAAIDEYAFPSRREHEMSRFCDHTSERPYCGGVARSAIQTHRMNVINQ